MQPKIKKIITITNCKKSFKDSFSFLKFKNIKNDDIDHTRIHQDEKYDNEKPFSQSFLTNESSISQKLIDFSNFFQIDYDKINIHNIDDCFTGILSYIYYHSENKLNINELEFHFSNAKNRQKLVFLEKYNSLNQYNIINIFEHKNIDGQFLVNSVENAFFGVTFLRIKVNPVSYSIRSGINYNHSLYLISFVFEGYDEHLCKWVILDERVNINDLNFEGGFKMFPVRKTTKTYSKFRIRQIEPSANGNWGFSIAAFEIHGVIYYRENINQQEENEIYEDENLNDNPYDPLEDLSKYIV